MFYEQKNSLTPDLIRVSTGINFNFPAHIHSSFELIAITDGEMTVTVNNKQYNVEKGKAVLIFPNEVHSFKTEKSSKHILCIFSPQLVKAYSSLCAHKSPDSHIFSIDERYIDELLSLNIRDSMLAAKGILYSICADFDKTAIYNEQRRNETELLSLIFRYVEDNYNKDCSLKAISDATSYHQVYLSRFFKACTGLNLTEHINRYRINEACYLLKNSKEKVLKIALDCGFDSLRSFNRNFKSIMNVTPCEYRER